MPLGCHRDATGMPLGIHRYATGVQRRVLSNIHVNINLSISMHSNISPTINIHILRCHWDATGVQRQVLSNTHTHIIIISVSISINSDIRHRALRDGVSGSSCPLAPVPVPVLVVKHQTP